jgi:transglutaminase-like putative cysteine protease
LLLLLFQALIVKLEVGCQISVKAEFPVPLILMLKPRSGWAQWVFREEYSFEPYTLVNEYVDYYGNICQRLTVPNGFFSIRATAGADTDDSIDIFPGASLTPIQDLPENTLQFLLPSRYCQSDQLGDLAQKIVCESNIGYEQVEAIRQWIQTSIQYEYGTSTASTSALETAQQKVGVCRDFAHLGIALCRSLNIPARMVVGYLYQLQPMDLHAWV